MVHYIARSCPKCHVDFWITMSHPTPQAQEFAINGYCVGCGYWLNGWKLIVKPQPPDVRHHGRTTKLLKR